MTKHVNLALVMAVLASCVPAHADTFPLGLPEGGSAPESAVPLESVLKVATAEAERVWGTVVLGPVIPCCDAQGQSIAYYVCFRLGGDPFPGFDEVLEGMVEGRALRLEGLRELTRIGAPSTPIALDVGESAEIPWGKSLTYDRGRRKTWGIGEYGTVLVSARYTMRPIPEYFEGLPRFFTLADRIAEAAGAEPGSTRVLRRVLFGGRVRQLFEFQADGETIYVDPFACRRIPFDEVSRIVPTPPEECEPDPALLDSFANAWQELESGRLRARTTHRIDHWDWVPILLWTGGCTPTACSMVFGFWDNKQPSGFYGGYGRLVDYYKSEHFCPDFSQCPGAPCWGSPGPLRTNIPNCLDELRVDLGTSACGGTNVGDIESGMEDFANTSPNNYSFSVTETQNSWIPFSPGWDWCWGAITDEIDAERPFHWVVTAWDGSHHLGHSLAAYGYTDDQYIGVYNTWDEQEHWWCHDSYGNSCNFDAENTWVFSAAPAGGEYPNDLYLYSPNGGEDWDACDPHTIQWYQYGDAITRVDILYSTNAGESWSTLQSNYTSSGQGWHTYEWTPPNGVAGWTTRVQVIGENSSGNTVAAEGSYGNFDIDEAYLGSPTNCSASEDRCDGIATEWDYGWSYQDQDGFKIRRDGQLVHTGTDPAEREWLDTGCSSGNHSYTIYAYNACEDGPNCSTSGRRLQEPTVSPSYCGATGNLCDGIEVLWNWSGTDQDGFKIERDGSLVHTGDDPGEREWFDQWCTPGDHDYTIYAYNICGDGPSCDTGGTRRQPPTGTPYNCAASENLCDGILVSWNWSGAEQDGFKIERDGSLVHTGDDPGEHEWFDQWCTPGDHSYTIYAYNDCGDGPDCGASGERPSESISLVAPNGGEIWSVGNTYAIEWEVNPCIASVQIELSCDGPTGPWLLLVPSTPNDGGEPWTVSGDASTNCFIRVSDTEDGLPSDMSDAAFTISAEVITLISPNGSEVWCVGEGREILWSSSGFTGDVRIELSRHGASGPWETLTGNTPDDGTEPWTVSGLASDDCYIRISDSIDGAPSDVSDGPFEIIVESVVVVSPDGGEIWLTGESHQVEWETNPCISEVDVELSRTGTGGGWETLFSCIPNDGSESWIVTGPVSVDCYMRVRDCSDGAPFDLSDAAFTIGEETVVVLSPNGGETWCVGTTESIDWTSQYLTGNVCLEVSRTGESGPWEVLEEDTPNDGSEPWVVSGVPSDNCYVRVSGAIDGIPVDVSDAPFSIETADVSVIAPNGGEAWLVGDLEEILWEPSLCVEYVDVDLSRNGLSGPWEPLAAAALNDGNQPWIVAGPVSSSCRIRVRDSSDGIPSDASNADFEIFDSICDTLDIVHGWSMVSLSMTPGDSSAAGLLPDMILYGYDNTAMQYLPAALLARGYGYWVGNIGADEQAEICGTPLSSWTRSLGQGWEMIGSVSTPVPFHDPQDIPDGSIIPGTLYEYDPVLYSYVSSDSILPGKGYWVATLVPCQLSVTAGMLARRPDGVAGVDRGSRSETEWLVILSVLSSGGESTRHLIVGSHPDATEGFDPGMDRPLPPPPADGVGLDAVLRIPDEHFHRLDTDLRDCSREQMWRVTVESARASEVQWDSEALPQDGDWHLIVPDGPEVDMRAVTAWARPIGGSYNVEIRYRPAETEPDEDPEITRFALRPPRPNPASGNVALGYDVPVPAEVTLTIYDVSGRVVKILVDSEVSQGTHMVSWNGMTSKGEEVPCGIYFCLMEAANHRETRRFVWLR